MSAQSNFLVDTGTQTTREYFQRSVIANWHRPPGNKQPLWSIITDRKLNKQMKRVLVVYRLTARLPLGIRARLVRRVMIQAGRLRREMPVLKRRRPDVSTVMGAIVALVCLGLFVLGAQSYQPEQWQPVHYQTHTTQWYAGGNLP